MPVGRSMRTHLLYSMIIIMLLIVIGVQALPRALERTVAIPGKDNKGSYTLRLLGSGDLIFEEHRFLPLASYRDYWAEMSVASVKWMEDRKALIMMTDGTQLTITLGNIEIASPNSPSSSKGMN